MNIEYLGKSLVEYLLKNGFSNISAELSRSFILLIIIVFLAIIANFFTKKVIVRGVQFFIKKSKNQYDDILLDRKVFDLLSHIIPALIIYLGVSLVFRSEFDYGFNYESVISLVRTFTYFYIIIVVLIVISRFLDSLHDIYGKFPMAKNVSIKGFVQVIKILVILIGLILIFSIIFDKKPTAVLTGLGAVAAVLMLVFKDTILGFVASIQLQAYDMIRPGDWIVVPGQSADGNVIEISLAAVKVRNWDKTITIIPTHLLSTKSFINWRGMEVSGARRIKRSISIDMKTVHFLDDSAIEKYSKVTVLSDYLSSKKNEIEEYNSHLKVEDFSNVNIRRLTNLGTFRKYLEYYLRNHPKVRQDFTLLVRHLQSGPTGLPIEIYVFSNDNRWAQMEELQSDIFDHILAVIPEFDLKVFQQASGNDIKNVIEAMNRA